MVDKYELLPHFEWLRGSPYYGEAVGEAVLAVELTALDRGSEMIRLGAAWMSASGVVWKYGVEEFVELARKRRVAGYSWCIEDPSYSLL